MNAVACPPFSPPLFLLPCCQRQGEWRSKYRCCVHRNSGARCLLSAMTASAAVEIKRPGTRKKLEFPLINCQTEQSQSRKGGTQLRSPLAGLGLAAAEEREETEMGRALLQALVGIMPLTQAQASRITALTKSRLSQSVSGECWSLDRDKHTEMRSSVRDVGQPSQHQLPDSTTVSLSCHNQLITSFS